MLLSRRCEYALRAMLYLAWQPEGASLTVRAVSSALEVPHAFLAKAMRDLAAAGLVGTQPGIGGGVTLARPAHDIPLKEVVLVMDGPEVFEACVLRLPGCGELAPCPLHEAWVQARARIDRMLSTTTLADVAEGAHREGIRLTARGELGS